MSDLKLQVMLSLKEKLLGPLNKLKTGSSSLAQALTQSKEALGNLQRQQNDISSFRKTKEAAGSTATQIKVSQDRVRALAIEMAATANPTKKLTTEFNKAKREAAALKDKHSAENAELQRLRTSLNAAGVSTRNLGEHEKRLRAEKDRLTQSMERERQKFNTLAAAKRKAMEYEAQKLEQLAAAKRRATALNDRYNNSLKNAAVLGGAGYAAQAVGRNVLTKGSQLAAPGIDYGAQISELQAITRLKKEDPKFAALKNQARELGASTQFSATEVAAGQTFLARAGFGAEAIKSAMPDVLAMAIANNTELSRTADIASNISSAFKVNPAIEGNMTRVADILSGTAARANVNLEMLGDTMKYLGGADDLNLTMEQAAAMAGMLGNIGIQGSMAGTTLRAMMNRLTNPVGKAADAIEELDLKIADARGNMRAMPDILADIAKATKNMGNVERKATLQNIFGAEAGSGTAELVSKMADGDMGTLIADLQNLKGENAKMASTMADNARGDLMGLKSAWEEVGISITDTNDGPLRELIQSITGTLRGVGAWIKANPRLAAGIAKSVAVIGILAVVLGSAAIAVASILGPLAMLRLGLGRIGLGRVGQEMASATLRARALDVASRGAAIGARLLGGGIGLATRAMAIMGAASLANPIVLGIMAVVALAAVVYKYWGPIKAFLSGFWDGLKEGLGPMFTAFGAYFSKLGEWLSPLKPLWDGIGAAIGGVLGWVTQLFAPFEATKEQLDGATSAGARFGEWLGNVIGFIPSVVANFATFGSDLIQGLIGGILGKAGALWEAMTGIASGIKERFKNILGIHSPSRIFIGYGDNTMEGLRLGLEGASGKAISVVHRVAASIADNKPLKAAAAGVMLTAGQLVMPDSAIANALATSASFAASAASGAPSIIDTRAPVKAGAKASAAAPITVMGDTITLSITAAPGMDARAIAAVVERMLADRERTKAARIRSTLGDLE